jgi:hypothetical protein
MHYKKCKKAVKAYRRYFRCHKNRKPITSAEKAKD